MLLESGLQPNTRIITSDLEIPVKDMELRPEEAPDVSVSQADEVQPQP